MDVLVLIDKLDDLVHNAKAVPLTDQVRIDREEIYDILDQMRATIPEEIKQARWIVKERQEMLAEAKRECDRILGEAREQAAREASQTEIVKLAERQAQEIIDEARRQARETRLEMEDWADGILSTLEVNLDKFLSAVKRGRERLHERSQENVLAGIAARRRRATKRRYVRPARRATAATLRGRAPTLLRCELDERLGGRVRRRSRCQAIPISRGGTRSPRSTTPIAGSVSSTVRRGHERDADAGGDEALDGAVVVRAEGDVRLAARVAEAVLDALGRPAGAVRDQRMLERARAARAAGRAPRAASRPGRRGRRGRGRARPPRTGPGSSGRTTKVRSRSPRSTSASSSRSSADSCSVISTCGHAREKSRSSSGRTRAPTLW